MNDQQRPDAEQRRLVQQIIIGSIPAGRVFDECRVVLQSNDDEDGVFEALFTLLRGALADPFLGIDETRRVVEVLRDLARGEVRAGMLM